MKKRIVVMCAMLMGSACFGVADFDYFQLKGAIEDSINKKSWLFQYVIGNEKRDLRIFLFNQLQDHLNQVFNKIDVDNLSFETEFKDKHNVDISNLASLANIKQLATKENINKYFNAIEDFYINKDGDNPDAIFKKLTAKAPFNYGAQTNDAQTAVNNEKNAQKQALYTYLYNRLITYRTDDPNNTGNIPQKLDTSILQNNAVAKNTGIANIVILVNTKSLELLDSVNNIIPYFRMIEAYYLDKQPALDAFTEFITNIKDANSINQQELIKTLTDYTDLITKLKDKNLDTKNLIKLLLSKNLYLIAQTINPDDQQVKDYEQKNKNAQMLSKLINKNFIAFDFSQSNKNASNDINKTEYDPIQYASELVKPDLQRFFLTYLYNRIQTKNHLIDTKGFVENDFATQQKVMVPLANNVILGILSDPEKINAYLNALYNYFYLQDFLKQSKYDVLHDLIELTEPQTLQAVLAAGTNLFEYLIKQIAQLDAKDQEYIKTLNFLTDKKLTIFIDLLEKSKQKTDFKKYFEELYTNYVRDIADDKDVVNKVLGADYATLDDLGGKKSANTMAYIVALTNKATAAKNDIAILVDFISALNGTFDEALQKKILNNQHHLVTKLLDSVKNEDQAIKERMAIQLISKGLDEWALVIDPTNKTISDKRNILQSKQKAKKAREDLTPKLTINDFIVFDFLQNTTNAEQEIKNIKTTKAHKDLLTLMYNTLQENWKTLGLSGDQKKITLLNEKQVSDDFKLKNGVSIIDLMSENILKALKTTSDDLADQIKINDYLNGIYQRFANNQMDLEIIQDMVILLDVATLKNNANLFTRPESLIGYDLKKLGELPSSDKSYKDMITLLNDNNLDSYKQEMELINKQTDIKQQQIQQQLLQQQQNALKTASSSVFELGKALDVISK